MYYSLNWHSTEELWQHFELWQQLYITISSKVVWKNCYRLYNGKIAHINANVWSHSGSHCPPQWQRAVHLREALRHLQCPPQPFLQPHRRSSRHASVASGRVVHLGSQQPVLLCCHPHSFGDGSSGVRISICPQQCTAWYTVLLTCCSSAAFVGGIWSSCLPFCVKSTFRASLTWSRLLVRSYNSTTKRSSVWNQSSIAFGNVVKAQNAWVTCSTEFQVFQQVFLPLPLNEDTVSQPVRAWNMGKE